MSPPGESFPFLGILGGWRKDGEVLAGLGPSFSPSDIE